MFKRINVGNLKNKIIKDDEKPSKKKDLRLLNYYDLDFGETMTIRLLPDGGDSEGYWIDYSKHGPNLKNREAGSITCVYASTGDECPACRHSFSFYNDGDKDEAKKWNAKTTYIAQCMVVDSPIEVSESEDGNPVKLMYLPFGMLETIKEALLNGIIEDPLDYEFVIKKTKNSGGYAEYSKSYFKPKEVEFPKEFEQAFDDGVAFLYDFSDELPESATTADVQEWLDNAIDVMSGSSNKNVSSSSSDDGRDVNVDDGDGDNTVSTKTTAAELMNRIKNRKTA